MNKKAIWAIVVVIVIILIVMSFNGKDSAPVSKEPVRVGAALMLTGPVALLGTLQTNAINLAVEKINSTGGINGRPLEVVVEDAAYDPKTAVTAYQNLKQKRIKNFIIDGSPVVGATRQLVVDDGNFTIAGAATAPSYFDGHKQTCRIALTAKSIAPGLADLANKNGYKKVAVFLPDNEAGRGLVEELNKVFAQKGITIVASEFYNSATGANDFRTSITKIKAIQSAVDAIVLSNVLNNVEAMLKQIKDLGITKPIISEYPTLTNPGLKDLTLVNGVEYVDYGYKKEADPTDSAETKAFKEAYKTKYNSDPILFAAAQYDSTMLLAEAIGKVGEDPQKIGDYMISLKNHNGITGMYSFNSDCEVERGIVFRKVVDGKIIDVK